ncbi:MAG: adenylate/guanylate cyclase domain-containing protein, partial [Desulfomonilaceae bacterium]|nr:adenylate/guanylate cyclase domain-containing protein [Desulfomonilaceae bacterium]
EKNARNLTLSVARRIEQDFRVVERAPAGLARWLELQGCDDKEKLKELIRSLVEDNPEVFGSAIPFAPGAWKPDLQAFAPYYYRARDGITYQQLASPTYNYFQQDYYYITKLLEAPIWTEPYFDEGGGNVLMVTYSVPLYRRNVDTGRREFRGVVTADVNLEWLTDLLKSIEVAQTGHCFIVSDAGVFVATPDRSLIMRESVFSLAEERNDPRLRQIGRAMIRKKSGFEDIGYALSEQDAFLAFARISSTGWSLGAIFPKTELLAEVTALHQRTILLASVGVVLLLVVSALVARSLARPLVRMAEATGKVAKGDLDIDLSDIRRTDEVGQLAEGFTRMVEGLKQRDFIRDTFGRYLTKEVVHRLLESKDGLKLGGEAREITLMMSDLRGFTALTSHMSPEQVIAFLNRYLARMVEILLDHMGVIDEIVGDGILAFFGAPEPLEDHPARAVACALRMQAAMERINELNEADGLAHLEMGVAVHTGTVVVGNIGSERRSKYGAVGSDVNFTGRVESFTVGGQVLISEATYRPVSHLVEVKNVLRVEMKGVPGKVTLYDVIGIGHPFNVRLPDRDDTPRPLREPLQVRVDRLEQKIVGDSRLEASLTHASLTSAILMVSGEIAQWENLRLRVDNRDQDEGEIYAKVVSMEVKDDGYEAVVRFTSMSPDVYRLIRQAAGEH